ncbi:MAG: HAD family hydrolase, partial [Pseudomonadota bacterium]
SAYVSRIEDFVFIEGIFNLCRTALSHGYLLIVVTNQAGIARGYYTEEDFLRLTDWMCRRFEQERAPITEVFYCPYHPEHGKGAYLAESFDRKPNPGMLLRAAEKYAISLAESIMIGDKESDMEAAMRAGVESRILLLAEAPLDRPMTVATRSINSLAEAGLLLRGDDGRSG